MIPVLLPLILMLPAPVKTLDCGHGHRLLAKQNTITLNRGKAPLAQSLTILAQDEPLACAWLKKHKLLTVRGARRTSIIAIAAGRLKVV
ncbi:hypothetical protein KJ865_03870, partial [Myxococcota bacterium]|nr:hypothetical protein [Myxococcota bacterium]